MNSIERVHAVLALKRPDRVPVALHNYLHVASATGVGNMGA